MNKLQTTIAQGRRKQQLKSGEYVLIKMIPERKPVIYTEYVNLAKTTKIYPQST